MKLLESIGGSEDEVQKEPNLYLIEFLFDLNSIFDLFLNGKWKIFKSKLLIMMKIP